MIFSLVKRYQVVEYFKHKKIQRNEEKQSKKGRWKIFNYLSTPSTYINLVSEEMIHISSKTCPYNARMSIYRLTSFLKLKEVDEIEKSLTMKRHGPLVKQLVLYYSWVLVEEGNSVSRTSRYMMSMKFIFGVYILVSIRSILKFKSQSINKKIFKNRQRKICRF